MVGGECERLDLGHLAELRDLMEDEFELLIEAFVSDGLQRVAQLQALANSADALRRAAHSLKGAASNVGALELARLCADLELLAQSGGLTAAHSLITAIEREFEGVRSSLSRLC